MNNIPFNESEITVSVVMISFNHEKIIAEAIQGVLMQKACFPIELIICNDGSIDDTHNIIEGHTKLKDGSVKIRYFSHEKNLGMMPNLIFGLEQCTGKYIAFCEGDDFWNDAYKLQKQVDLLESNLEVGACFTNAIYLNEMDGVKYDYVTDLAEGIIPDEKIFETGGSIYPTASLIFRKNLLEIEIFKAIPELAGDELIIYNIASKSKIYFLDQITCIYRRWSGGAYSSISKDVEKLVHYKQKDIIGYLKFNELTDSKYAHFLSKKIKANSKFIIKHAKSYRAKAIYLKHLTNKEKIRAIFSL